MAEIGGVVCNYLRGNSRAASQRVKTWTVPGLSGYGARRLGLGDAPGQFTLVKYGTHAAIAAWYALILALRGTVVTAVDDWGASHSYFLITRIGTARRSASGQYGCRAEVEVEGIITQ